jgi:hypothetical protein
VEWAQSTSEYRYSEGPSKDIIIIFMVSGSVSGCSIPCINSCTVGAFKLNRSSLVATTYIPSSSSWFRLQCMRR